MAKKKSTNTNPEDLNISDYRFDENKRKNIPPAGLAAQGVMENAPKQQFYYDPHLPPVLRFDDTGENDKLPELIEKSRQQALNDEEVQLLVAALRKQEPWLEWTGKREKKWFEVDPVALNIHERVSTQAILKIAKRENVQRDLFADPDMEYKEAVKFYKHDMDWANRLILGDSLQVMASLAYRENLAGQVQMIYFDPPYGIKFASNFQSQIGKRDVKDTDSDLTRETEMIKAYRDTWTLGVHSYLNYLRERLILSKKLLKDTGSIFVQISDTNLHLIKNLMDEIFGRENFGSIITFSKAAGQATDLIPSICDYIIWYTKIKEKAKFFKLYLEKEVGGSGATGFTLSENISGEIRSLTKEEIGNPTIIDKNGKIFDAQPIVSQGWVDNLGYEISYEGETFTPPPNRHWTTTKEGMDRVSKAGRLIKTGNTLQVKKYIDDFPVTELGNFWIGLGERGFAGKKLYVVQTAAEAIKRCMLMTTEPGDLILDPTCGSGTSAFVAEQWGRRWITIDTSRVAVALARQRLLTSKFDHYKLRDSLKGPSGENKFIYESVPYISLKSIAQNLSLDPIFNKYDPLLEDALNVINIELRKISKSTRDILSAKLQGKQKIEGKRSISEAERRRWDLPEKAIEHWEVPFDTDEAYTASFGKAVEKYRSIWRQKMTDVDACIQANAEHIELVDKPDPIKNVVRVSGPFTVEGVIPAEFNLEEESLIESISGELEAFDVATNAISFIDNIYSLLKHEGVNFTNNKHRKFSDLRSYDGGGGFIHFEGEWANGDKTERKVGVSVGPQHGPVTAWQVENVIRMAYKRGFDDVVFAGFSFTAEAQAAIQDDANPKVQLHLAQIRPDVQMGDLLKNTGSGQVFTVFGSPRIELLPNGDGQLKVEMQGVDVYDPVENTIVDTKANKVAAWFLDSDYDGRTFCITQAFFPDRDAWKKLEKALKGIIDEDKFETLSGTISLPFPIGEHRKAAVKVIDPRGNEVMKVLSLNTID